MRCHVACRLAGGSWGRPCPPPGLAGSTGRRRSRHDECRERLPPERAVAAQRLSQSSLAQTSSGHIDGEEAEGSASSRQKAGRVGLPACSGSQLTQRTRYSSISNSSSSPSATSRLWVYGSTDWTITLSLEPVLPSCLVYSSYTRRPVTVTQSPFDAWASASGNVVSSPLPKATSSKNLPGSHALVCLSLPIGSRPRALA